jgi:hypothetical protein
MYRYLVLHHTWENSLEVCSTVTAQWQKAASQDSESWFPFSSSRQSKLTLHHSNWLWILDLHLLSGNAQQLSSGGVPSHHLKIIQQVWWSILITMLVFFSHEAHFTMNAYLMVKSRLIIDHRWGGRLDEVNKLGKICKKDSWKRGQRYEGNASEKTINIEDLVMRQPTLMETSMYDSLLVFIYFWFI